MKRPLILCILLLSGRAVYATHNNIYDIHTDTITVQNAIVFHDGTVLTSTATIGSGGGSSPASDLVLSNQSADLSTTTVFTAATTGIYLVSVYIVTTTSDGGAGNLLFVNLYFTDSVGAKSIGGNTDTDLTNSGGYGTAVQPLEIAAGQTLAVTTTGGGTYGAARYKLYVSALKI